MILDLINDLNNWDFERNRKSLLGSFKSNGDTRISFYDKVSSFIKAGVPIMKVLKAFDRQKKKRKKYEKDPEWQVVNHLITQMNNGYSFSKGLEEIIPANEFLLMAAGEKSGTLPKNLALCAQMIKDNQLISKAVRSATTYPTFMFVALIGLFYALGAGMLPTLEKVAPVEDWSLQGQMLHTVANAIVNNIPYIATTVITLFIAIKMSLSRLVHPFRLKYLDRVHPYKIYRTIQSTFFLLAIGSLLKSGIKTSEALAFLYDKSPPYTKAQVGIMLDRLSMGLPAAAVIATEFLGDSADDIELYGMSGDFDDALILTAEKSKEDTTDAINTFSSRFGSLMFGLVGLSAVWGISSFLSISSSIAKSQAS